MTINAYSYSSSSSVRSTLAKSDLSQSGNDSTCTCVVNFRQVRERLDEQRQGTLPQLASRVRQYGHHSMTSDVSDFEKSSKPLIACEVDGDYLEGGFHLVARLKFTDGLRWVIKIPANGHGDHFSPISRKALRSEALTMQMVKRETTIPVPRVHAFDASLENEINVPYILMDQVDGSPLRKVWHQQDIPMSRNQHIRTKALRDLAAAMVQLRKFTFDRSGTLDFNADGTIRGVESAKAIDHRAMWDKDEEIDDEGTKHEDYEILFERGPFTDPKSFFTFMLDRDQEVRSKDTGHKDYPIFKGNEVCLGLFIDWAFDRRDASGGRNDAQAFVLAHPDLNLSNIIVGEDGSLRGIIDWDAAAVVPRAIGCTQYPIWLMDDWDTIYYTWPETQMDDENRRYRECSPDELACYRAMYAHFIELEVARTTKAPLDSASLSSLQKEEGDLTRRSLVMWALWVALTIPPQKGNMVGKIYTEIEDLENPRWRNGLLPSPKQPSSEDGEHDQHQHEHKENDPDLCEKNHSEIALSPPDGHTTAVPPRSDKLALIDNSQVLGVGRLSVGKTQTTSEPLLNLAQNAPDRVLIENEASTNDSNSQPGSVNSSTKADDESMTDESPPSTIRKERQGPLGHEENVSKDEAANGRDPKKYYPHCGKELDENLTITAPPTDIKNSDISSNGKDDNNDEHTANSAADILVNPDEEEDEDKENMSKVITSATENQKIGQRIGQGKRDFDEYVVLPLLARGELDEARMSRLKEGFLTVLETY